MACCRLCGRTPGDRLGEELCQAVSEGRQKKIETLLTSGNPDINAKNKAGYSATMVACEVGNMEALRFLLEHKADVDDKNTKQSDKTPIHYALDRHKDKRTEAILQLLIQHRANLDWPEKTKGWTPLIRAARRGDLRVIRLLLENGAKVDSVDANMYTALHHVSRRGHNKCAQCLLEFGAPKDKENDRGETPLHHACKHAVFCTAELLIDAKCNINALNHKSDTPLHLAAALGHANIVELLISKGADGHLENNNNQTPADVARSEAVRAVLMGGRASHLSHPHEIPKVGARLPNTSVVSTVAACSMADSVSMAD